MAWIESHQSLSRHKKTLALAALLKTDRHKVLGHMHELWWWGLDNADVNGHLGEVSANVIAEAAGWPLTTSRVFLDALVTSGFVDVDEDGLTLHDWYDYAGKFNDRRDQNRERMRRKRDESRPPEPPPSSARAAHVLRTNGAQLVHVQDTDGARAPATVPNLTVPNLTGQTPPTTSAPPAGRKRRVTEADEDFRSELEEQFWPAYGSREALHDCIDTAMAHKARLKCTDERAYLRNWVRKDAERRGKRPPPGRPTPITIVRASSPASAQPQPVQVACEDCGGETYRSDPDSPWCYPCLAARKKATA